MISEDHLKRVAAWSRELTPAEIEVARAGITERSYGTGETVFMSSIAATILASAALES